MEEEKRSGDDGKLKQEEKKTEEQLNKERLERYTANPYSFVEMQDIILCVIRNPESGIGMATFIGNCKRTELDIGITELSHLVQKKLMNWDMESQMKKEAGKHIIPGSMLNFMMRKR